MKRRITPILITGIAVILIGSIAYAADRRKQAKYVNQPIDPTHEEETLRAELLEAVADHEKKAPAAGDTEKVVGYRADKKINQSKPGE